LDELKGLAHLKGCDEFRAFVEALLNPRFPPTILMSLTSSQVLRRPPEVT
jgi:hypothetical protein